MALDLSVEMLRRVERQGKTPPELVRADGIHPPFRRAAFHEVVVLGNALGFAGVASDQLWAAAGELVVPGGCLILEIVAGAGERSRYLCRLPPTALGRLFRAPTSALLARVEKEGFALDLPRKSDPGSFRRYNPDELKEAIARRGWWVEETLAVAPALGGDRERLEGVVGDPIAWSHLIELEEAMGRPGGANPTCGRRSPRGTAPAARDAMIK